MSYQRSSLVAIDPGNQAGLAYFISNQLIGVDLITQAVANNWKWDGPNIDRLVCELPCWRKGSPVRVDSLITLAYTAGYITGQIPAESIETVLPHEWKGNRPKNIDNSFSLRILNVSERAVVDDSKIPKHIIHNVLDAVGIGLWALKRR